MKTTLVIDDTVMDRLRQEARRRGQTMSALVEAALRRMLEEEDEPRDLPPLPRFAMGRPTVDVADREALYELMDGR